jgi:Arc/MetJ family transcription regulator
MVNGKTPFYLGALILGLLGGAVLLFQPYSADWPGTAFAKPSRQYIRAALHQDSMRLVQLSTSSAAVHWALHAARTHPDALRLWQRRIEAFTGAQNGDTTEVFVYPTGAACDDAPLVLRFIGTGRRVRVLAASSKCWAP